MINERYAHQFCRDDISKIENYDEAIHDKTLSDDTRRKISEAKKGKHWKIVDGKRVWY